MKFLKVFSFAMIVLMLIIFGSVAFADDSKTSSVILEQSDEITNIAQLEYNAEHGITDLADNEIPQEIVATLECVDSGDELEATTYTTSQILKKELKKNGDIEMEISTTAFVEVTNNDLALASEEGGTRNNEGLDKTGAIKAYATIKYKIYRTGTSAGDGYKLESASGGWINTNSPGSITLSNKKVRYQTIGPDLYGGPAVLQNIVENPTAMTYSRTTGFTKYVATGMAFEVGVKTDVLISNGTSSWYLYFDLLY